MSETKNKITLILFQYSVVVKGIEKKLLDQGFDLNVVSDVNEFIRCFSANDLFILYLPGDITDDKTRSNWVFQISDIIHENKKSLITIGEHSFYNDTIAAFPELSEHTWIDRPVDMDTLVETVRKELASSGTKQDKKRVLIVDDDPSYARMVKEWIKDVYKTDIVTAGMQAITFLLKNPVDIILLDYEMPVVDGPQVLQMLRQEPSTKDIPVVFLTGVGTREGVARVMSLKPSGYILKSTTRWELLSAIKEKIR